MGLLTYACSLLSNIGFWAIAWPWFVMAPIGFFVFVFPTALIALRHLIVCFLPARISKLFVQPDAWPRRLPDGVWTIHGRRYDLSRWAEHHPGGSWALELGRNRDCTGLFESYHTFANQARLQATLKQFELPSDGAGADGTEVDRSNATGLVFGCAFHEDVRKMAREHFAGGKSHKTKPAAACVQAALVALMFVLMYYFMHGNKLVVPILPFVAWLVCCNVAHDASHFSCSRSPTFNRVCSWGSLPFVYSPTAWHIQHTLQHHVYTNDEFDVDLFHWLPLARASKFSPFSRIHEWQWLTIFMMTPTASAHLLWVVPSDLLSGARDMITGKQRYEQCENHEDLAAAARTMILLETGMAYAWFFGNVYMLGAWEAFWRCSLSYSIASYLFIFFTQGAHLSHGLDDGVVPGESWAKRQVASAVNFSPRSLFWMWMSGGLNMQGLHHVLPSIASSHFMDMWPKYKEICTRHGVELKEVSGFRVFVNGFYNWVHELSVDENKSD